VRTGLQRSLSNVKMTINPPVETQSISSLPRFAWPSVVVVQPSTRDGQFVASRFGVAPAVADLIANLAGLGQEAS